MHDIECGLLLKASAVDFEYNGVRHQKGSLRVIKVEQDGVCKVWLFGICPVRQQLALRGSDVLVHAHTHRAHTNTHTYEAVGSTARINVDAALMRLVHLSVCVFYCHSKIRVVLSKRR
jgi:hypothetical protein